MPETSPNSERRYLTVKEVAAELEVSLGTVYELIRNRKLSALHVGAVLKVTPEALQDFIRRNTTGRQPGH